MWRQPSRDRRTDRLTWLTTSKPLFLPQERFLKQSHFTCERLLSFTVPFRLTYLRNLHLPSESASRFLRQSPTQLRTGFIGFTPPLLPALLAQIPKARFLCSAGWIESIYILSDTGVYAQCAANRCDMEVVSSTALLPILPSRSAGVTPVLLRLVPQHDVCFPDGQRLVFTTRCSRCLTCHVSICSDAILELHYSVRHHVRSCGRDLTGLPDATHISCLTTLPPNDSTLSGRSP